MTFKTTLLRALRSAELVQISGYLMEVLDYGGDDMGSCVRIVLDSCEMVVFFDGDQEISIEEGSAAAMACADPENDEDDWGDLFEVEGYPKDEPLFLEFIMKRAMTEEDLI